MLDIGTDLDTLEVDGELKPKAKKKKPGFWHYFWSFVWIIVFTTVISISSQIIYNYTRYTSFFVSGDSMYPTLNRDATRTRNGVTETHTTSEGSFNGFGDYNSIGSVYVCDYGLMDASSGFVSSLKLFDIVVTFYDGDTIDGNGNGVASSDRKVKRVFGFPGDSLYFDSLGGFWLKKPGEEDYSYVAQPESITNDENGKWLPSTVSGATYGTKSNPAILQDGEYFVVGDNRRPGSSSDCRSKGPLGIRHRGDPSEPTGAELLRGKAVSIIGKEELTISSVPGGEATHKLLWTSLKMPWNTIVL